jgi:hypothetical protein
MAFSCDPQASDESNAAGGCRQSKLVYRVKIVLKHTDRELRTFIEDGKVPSIVRFQVSDPRSSYAAEIEESLSANQPGRFEKDRTDHRGDARRIKKQIQVRQKDEADETVEGLAGGNDFSL